MFENRKNRIAALKDGKEIFFHLNINLTAELEAKFLDEFNKKYKYIKKDSAVRGRFVGTESAKTDFISGMDWKLDLTQAGFDGFSNHHPTLDPIENLVGSLGNGLGGILGIIQFWVYSPMMVQSENVGMLASFSEQLKKRMTKLMAILQKENKSIVLKNISNRADDLSKECRSNKRSKGLAYGVLVHIAAAFQTKG